MTTHSSEDGAHFDPGQIVANELAVDLLILERWAIQWEQTMDPSASEAASIIRRVVRSTRYMNQVLSSQKQNDEPIGRLRSLRSNLKQQASKMTAVLRMHEDDNGFHQGTVGIATPAVLCVEERMLIHSRWGDWMMSKGWMGFSITGCLIFLLLCSALAETTSEDVAVYENGRRLVQHRSHAGWSVVMILIALLVWLQVAHNLNRQLFLMTLKTFPCIMITGSQFLSNILQLFNLYATVGRAGLFDAGWQALSILSICLLYFPGALFIATLDSFCLKRAWVKMVLVTLALVHFSTQSFRHRFLHDGWSSLDMSESIGVDVSLGTARSLFCYLLAQITAFLANYLIAQCRGCTFGAIMPVYMKPKPVGTVFPHVSPPHGDDHEDMQRAPPSGDVQRTPSSRLHKSLAEMSPPPPKLGTEGWDTGETQP